METYLKLIELGYYELTFVFEGLADENVWKRPAEGLLSIGELAGHLAGAEAIRFAGEGEDLSRCRIQSPLVDNRFWYLPRTLPIPGCPSGFTYGEFLEYDVFHVAYHTGQMYSVRHLLGEETPDN